MPILNWLGRDEALKTAAKTPYKLLEEVPELGYGDKNTDNMIIQGDNLEALKALLPFYAGQVKCIYIDPPYNTGSAFEHYDDNLEHSQWLSLMAPRLELLKEFLSEDGSIFISIDDNEKDYLKVIMDEIFGRNNFITTITVITDARTRNYAAISPTHEYVLAYRKSQLVKLYPSVNHNKKFQYMDSNGGFDLYELRNRNASFNSENRPNLFYPFYLNPKEQDENGLYKVSLTEKDGWIRVLPQKSGDIQTVWRQSKETVLPKLNKIIFGKKSKNGYQIVKKYREIESPFSTVWTENEVLSDRGTLELKAIFGKKVFDFPKPEELISKVLALSTKEEDLVLDSFLGSGTTAAVAHKMGRRYIGIEMGEHAKTHCVPRLKAVIDGEQGGISKSVNWNGGGGFRFYKLGSEIFDADGFINGNISFENLSAHIWFTETKIPFNKPKQKSTYLGTHEDTAYALLYNGILKDKRVDGGNVLTNKTLTVILNDMDNKPYEKLVIYGESSRISANRLKELHIEFKQTPYDIKAR